MDRRMKILKEDLNQWHNQKYKHLNHDYIFSKKLYEGIQLHKFKNIIINRKLLWNFRRNVKDLFNELTDLEKASNNQLPNYKIKLRSSKFIFWKFLRLVFGIKHHQAWIKCFQDSINNPNLIKIESAICFVHSGDDHSWSHFMQDTSHLVINQVNFLKRNKDFKILFFQQFNHIKFFLRNICNLENEIVYIKNKNIRLDTLYFPSFMPMTRYFESIVPSDFLLPVKNKIQRKLKDSNEKYLLYQTRTNVNRRNVLNENQIIKLLKKYSKNNNLTFINFLHSDFTFEERFNLYYNSKIIVAPHGGASYHILACKPDTLFIEFSVENSIGLLAPALVDYHVLLVEKNKSKKGHNKDYKIETEKLIKILEKKNCIDLYNI